MQTQDLTLDLHFFGRQLEVSLVLTGKFWDFSMAGPNFVMSINGYFVPQV